MIYFFLLLVLEIFCSVLTLIFCCCFVFYILYVVFVFYIPFLVKFQQKKISIPFYKLVLLLLLFVCLFRKKRSLSLSLFRCVTFQFLFHLAFVSFWCVLFFYSFHVFCLLSSFLGVSFVSSNKIK